MLRGLLSRLTRCGAYWMRRRTDQERARVIARLCAAGRLASTEASIARIQRLIHQELPHVRDEQLDWAEFVPDIQKNLLIKATLLKPYIGPREMGVLFVSFERQWIKLLRHGDLKDFASRYTLIISPSSSPHNLVNYAFAAAYPEPYFTLISNPEDLVELPRVSERLRVVPLLASHWVNPEHFSQPPRKDRPFDLLMIASFGKVKRHHVLFKALRRMPRDIRVLLIGHEQDGRTAATLEEEARWYGVQGRYEMRGRQPYLKAAAAYAEARTSLVLSKREGSCVVVAESMFADTPVAVLEDAHLGSRTFMNERTGRLVRERSLAYELTQFIREAERFEPHAWALENIACGRSSRALNDFVKDHALRAGQEWTRDLCPMQWCPDPLPLRPEDRVGLENERRIFQERYGLEVGWPVERAIT